MPPTLLLLFSATANAGDSDPPTTETAPDLRTKPLILVKIWCLIIVFVAAFVAGVSPYLMKRNEGFVLLGTQFAGGVFLATALMEFLSDSNETFTRLTSKSYPFAFMLACAGYLLTMFADRVVLYVYLGRKKNIAPQEGIQQIRPTTSVGTSRSQIQVVNNGMEDRMDPSFFTAISFGDSVLLIVTLCFHSLFEGIAIGVAETKARAWRALWIVSLHKVFVAIAMGISLLRLIPDRTLLSCTAYAFAFSISTPVGIAIGIVIDSTKQGILADWIYAISSGLSCGVLIYISIHHLVFKGYSPQRRLTIDIPSYKFLAVLLGFGTIAVVMIWDT